jgi:hypothetical protein
VKSLSKENPKNGFYQVRLIISSTSKAHQELENVEE